MGALSPSWARCLLLILASLVLALLLELKFPSPSAQGTGLFQLRDLGTRPPFSRVIVWAPTSSRGEPPDVLLLLHGRQEGARDPNWMAWLRERPPFHRKILVVPALPAGRTWSQPESIKGLEGLLSELLATWPTPKERTTVVGFSAGAIQGFPVAAALSSRVGGLAAFAGNLSALRPADASRLKNTRILVACMELDKAFPCSAVPFQAASLMKYGISDVSTRTVAGLAHECDLNRVAPVLLEWLEARPISSPAPKP